MYLCAPAQNALRPLCRPHFPDPPQLVALLAACKHVSPAQPFHVPSADSPVPGPIPAPTPRRQDVQVLKDFATVSMTGAPPLILSVPVGQAQHTGIVVGGTLLVIAAATAALLLAISTAKPKAD